MDPQVTVQGCQTLCSMSQRKVQYSVPKKMVANEKASAEFHQAWTSKIFDKETRQEILREISK